jgi:phosphohistidine phosphatase
MKELIVIRHAKSSWANPGMHDHQRPLNSRGERDAPEMSIRLRDFTQPGHIVTSDARRALETAMIFKKKLDIADANTQITRELYHASSIDMLSLFRQLSNEIMSIMSFSHNPGITNFVNHIPGVRIDNVPTCGIAIIQCDTDNWKELTFDQMSMIKFMYPKMYK